MKKSNTRTIILSLIVMMLWGTLFSFVKIGYSAFNIKAGDLPNILMFAGARFFVSGIIICTYCFIKKEKIATPKFKNIRNIFIAGLFSVVLHYTFSYTGLSLSDGSKSALINQLGTLIYVCFAFLFFKNEKFSISKILGALIGFCGIIAINYNPEGIRFSIGDIFIIGASFCSVITNVIGKKCLEAENSPFWVTGIGQFTGGIILLAAAFIMGADMLTFDWWSTAIFTYICFASIAAYCLWNYVLKSNSVSKMFIIKFAEPLFACVFGAVLLGENIFKIQYLVAFILISLGITLGNKSEAGE